MLWPVCLHVVAPATGGLRLSIDCLHAAMLSRRVLISQTSATGASMSYRNTWDKRIEGKLMEMMAENGADDEPPFFAAMGLTQFKGMTSSVSYELEEVMQQAVKYLKKKHDPDGGWRDDKSSQFQPLYLALKVPAKMFPAAAKIMATMQACVAAGQFAEIPDEMARVVLCTASGLARVRGGREV